MTQESYGSQQEESISSHLLDNFQQNKSSAPQIIESNLIYQNPRRQIDYLYEDICEKNLHPKELLKKYKSNQNISLSGKNTSNLPSKSAQKHFTVNKSMQDQIVLSNYKQILRNQLNFQLLKDHQYKQLHRKYQEQQKQSQLLYSENLKLKKQLKKMKKKQSERQEQIKRLDNSLKQLNRRYSNLLKESQTKYNIYQSQTKKLREQKQSYQNLVEALKESIHILKGKKVKDLSQIWNQWKHIFQIASLQQCKLVKKNTKS